jgi:hypothetical protein
MFFLNTFHGVNNMQKDLIAGWRRVTDHSNAYTQMYLNFLNRLIYFIFMMKVISNSDGHKKTQNPFVCIPYVFFKYFSWCK